MNPLRWFSWKRFSLRSLLIVMTVCCLLMAGWSKFVDPYRRQANALEAVKQWGGQYTITPAEGPDWQRWLVTKLLGDEAFAHVTTVRLSYCRLTDDRVPLLGQLTNLKTLYLTGNPLTDAAVDELAKLARLNELYIRWTRISEAGEKRLAAAMPDCVVYHHALVVEATDDLAEDRESPIPSPQPPPIVREGFEPPTKGL